MHDPDPITEILGATVRQWFNQDHQVKIRTSYFSGRWQICVDHDDMIMACCLLTVLDGVVQLTRVGARLRLELADPQCLARLRLAVQHSVQQRRGL